jgi:nitrogenase molybdenum-iron protein beta chain
MTVKTVECIERPRAACALSGALAAMSAMPRVVPIIHSAVGCGGALSGAYSFGAGYLGSGYSGGFSAPTSGVTEREIVFGGAERLREEIESALELIDADLFVVATGCMTEMIGDDVDAVVSEFDGSGGTPVINISTPSFKGNAYYGYELLLDGIFNKYLPPSGDTRPNLVNIFGVVPAYDPFFRGDLEEIARLLGRLGLRANTFFTPDQTFANIQSAPEAALNIVFSRVYAQKFARNFEKRHGVPYWVTDLPIGAAATERFIAELGRRLGVDSELTERVIASETREYYAYFSRAADVFADGDMKYYSICVTNSNYAAPVASYLQNELGWVGLDAYITDTLDDAQKGALSPAFAELGAELLFETDASRIAKTVSRRHPENRGQRYFNDIAPLYIVGSSLEKPLAAARSAAALAVSFPVYNRLITDRSYAGFRGGLHLFEDLLSSLFSGR